MMTNYEKELNHLKERILKDGDTLVSKRDLLERFCEVDEEYNGEPWNLLQILNNIHILIGEEPCEDAISREEVHEMLENVPIAYTDKWFNWKQKACLRLANLPSVIPKDITVTDFADKCRECGKLRKSYKEKNKNNK